VSGRLTAGRVVSTHHRCEAGGSVGLVVFAGAFDATELVCGSCSALATGSNCPEHGSKYVEWKCK